MIRNEHPQSVRNKKWRMNGDIFKAEHVAMRVVSSAQQNRVGFFNGFRRGEWDGSVLEKEHSLTEDRVNQNRLIAEI